MADLPYAAHRYLVGHLAGGHMRLKIIKDYLGFINRIRKSPKFVLRQLYQLAAKDARTVTGSNLRNILLQTNRLKVEDLHPGLVDSIMYHSVKEDQMWRIGLVKELIDLKHGCLCLPEGWKEEELSEILNVTCTQ